MVSDWLGEPADKVHLVQADIALSPAMNAIFDA
jgi:hypothetical protein